MWIVSDCSGKILLTISYIFFTTNTAMIVLFGILPLSQKDFNTNLLLATYLIIVFLSIWSHLSCWTTNPGTINFKQSKTLYLKLLQQNENPQICEHCLNWKPPRTHHCGVCDKCVLNMDHHCPWINNCVGLYTQKQFILFLVYTWIFCVMSLVILVLKGVYCQFFCYAGYVLSQKGAMLFLTVVCGLVCIIVWGILTQMMLKQAKHVIRNTNKIDQLQMRKFKRRDLRVNLGEVFGSNWYFWVLPVRAVTYPREINVLS